MGYDKEDEIASKYIEVHYIELPKFKKKELLKFTKLDQWMCIFTQNREGIMLAEKENKEIKRAINTLDFLSKDPKERERHNSIVMAEYNRLVSEHNFFNDGLEKGMKQRSKRKNSNKYDSKIYKIGKGRNRKIEKIKKYKKILDKLKIYGKINTVTRRSN